MKSLNHKPYSLSNNEARVLYEDSQGIIWVGHSRKAKNNVNTI